MTVTKKEHKTVLLLSPQRLLSDHLVLQSLHVTRSKVNIEYSNSELHLTEINTYFSMLPKQAKDVLFQFHKNSILKSIEAIQNKFNTQKAGVAYETFYQNAIKRRLHELFETFKPFAGLVSWYHTLKIGKSNYKTAPCSFSYFKPQLQFEVKQEKKLLQLNVLINLNGTVYSYANFIRYHFLLESNNEYFLLSYKDFLTLEWLQNNDPSKYSSEPTEFARQVLAKLENDYTVNRNNLLSKIEIDAIPDNRVLLSEISQKFLVVTPQWTYDGLLVEGPWKDTFETTINGDTYLVQRNREAEKAFLAVLESLHANFPAQRNGYYYLSFEEAQKKQWFLKVFHKLLEMNIQIIGMDMLQHFRYSSHKIIFESEIIKQNKNTVILRVSVSFGSEDVSLTELQKLLISEQRSILLKDGSIGVIHDEWLQQYGILFKHGKISGKEIQIARWFALYEEETPENEIVLKGTLEKSWWQKWHKWKENTETIYPLPAIIQATLRPYQLKGYEWLMLLAEAGAGACLADDMGLGKTLQTICFIAHQIQEKPDIQHLIVCPSSLIYNWQKELLKFTPGISTFVHHGAGRGEGLQKEKYQIIITSYGTLRSDIEYMSTLNFGVVVLDESHNIKNPAALTTRAVLQVHSLTRITLSGTPIMNNTFDLFSQLNFILPGMFGSREFFKREYADSIDRDHNPDKIKALKKLTSPFVLRRTKQQVAKDLPSKTEMIMWCTMSQPQKNLYDEIKTTIRDSVFLNIKNEGFNKSKLAILQGMLKLRQLCNSPLLLPVEEQSNCTESVKTGLLMNELTNNLKDHKVLVFSQFTGMLRLLAQACQEQEIAYYHFDGQTPPAKRTEMVDRFQQEEDTTRVFLISLKAGNTGLNLTAADYVFLFDPWWNTAVQQQAIDRTHRIGQTKNVFAYKMICKDTIEEKITEIQERKKKLADDLVSEDEGFVQSLTEDDIEYLFS
ncbi:MAG: DEAD/DEAH box helicase [Chitinophagaceae bacterium]